MTRTHRTLSLLALLLLASQTILTAQENPNVTWKLLTPSISGAPGQTVDLKVQAIVAAGSHMYSTKKYPADALGPQPTEITVGEKELLTIGGRVKGPKPIVKKDENFDGLETEYWEGTVTLTVPVKIAKKAKPGKAKGWVNCYFMSCDDRSCMPGTEKKFAFDVEVKEDTAKNQSAIADTSAKDIAVADTVAATPAGSSDSTSSAPIDSVMTATARPSDTAKATLSTASIDDTPTGSLDDIAKAQQEGLGAYLGLAALMGALALLTPCVFPMIPITVSFFTKRTYTSRKRSLRDASLYSLGIILTFTLIGFLFSVFLGASGINDFATNPIVNLAVATIFILLALNLFGMFEIQIPSSILTRLNAKTQDDGNSVVSVMLMGLLFSLTSFTCTVPFVGGLMVSATGGNWLWPLMGMAVFSAVFSAPFFLLALFPALLKSLPKSGGWLNSVKVVMGFLETAAAIKFLSNADLVWEWGFLTREFFLAIWVAIAVITTVYLLGRFQLPHDTPVEKVGPIRILFAMGSLAIGFWLLTGLFGGRLGELDAFIAPQEYPGKGNTSLVAAVIHGSGGARGTKGSNEELDWMMDDYQKALATARKSGKPIFIDFTGYTCTNCRWMEQNMFTREDVADLMKKYVLVRLYTDGRKPIHKQNRDMQVNRFKTIALPYYAVVTPQDSIVGTFPGMTRKPAQFVEFLRQGVAEGKLAVR
jgi:thiol:disulfide interchange protein DsbD